MFNVYRRFGGTALLLFTPLLGRAAVPETTRVLVNGVLGQNGIYSADEGVYKFVIPREAATVVQDWESLSPNLGLNSWFAFSSAIHHEAILAGELLLFPDEVDPVMGRILDAGLEITGLSECSAITTRRLYALNVLGHGTFAGLAGAIRRALDQVQASRRDATSGRRQFVEPVLPATSAIDPDPLNEVLAMRGAVSGGVYSAAFGRQALLTGEGVGGEMGMRTWISISGTNRQAFAHGEVLASSDELQDVLKALQSKGVSVTAIRNHALGEHP